MKGKHAEHNVGNRGNTDTLAGLIAQTPLKRLTTPEEIAEAAIWLCSEAASGVTGQTLLIDSGYAIPGNRFDQTTAQNEKACRERRCGRHSKEMNNGWEEECRCSARLPLGGGVGRLNHEALREEVHHFVETLYTAIPAAG